MKGTVKHIEQNRKTSTRRISLVILLVFTCAPLALSQDAGLPPLGKDAIEHLGQVVRKYDKFTDKSKIELALKVKGDYLNGTFLIALCVFNGQIVPTNAKAVLGVAAVGDKYEFETNNKIILLADDQRQVYDPQRFVFTLDNGKVLELLLISRGFSADELLALAGAQKLEGRAGSYDEFAVSPAQRQTLQEFVSRMRPPSEGPGSVAATARVIELPSNFRYRRELGEVTGLPVYILMPEDEAMEADAQRGNVFQALGVLAQPEANKVGLTLINAQTQYQLQINQTKGAYITIGTEVIHIPDYQVLLKRDIGKLKMETAAIKISNDILWKLVKADRITVQCGMVVYELDQDNIDALKYLAAQIEKDGKTTRH